MHFEPWHMFTSFLQYLFLLPSYVNILSKYNKHTPTITVTYLMDSDVCYVQSARCYMGY